jgi:hypothetical protein
MAPLVLYVVSAVATAFEAVGVAAFWAWVAAEVVVYGGMIYGMFAYSASQQRKMQRSLAAAMASVDTGRSMMIRDPIAARQIVYGEVLKSGSISFFEVGGTNNEYLYLNIDIADHECYELGTIYFDKEEVPLDGSGNATGRYAGYVRVKKFLGIAAGERDTDLESELPALWTDQHLGKGQCRLHVRLTNNTNLFPGQYPLIEVMVKGKLVYDFRTATTGWSKNSALITADFLMDTRVGKGIAMARIISADVIEAANICDETMVLADDSEEPRYETNGVVNTDNDPDVSLVELESAMAGCVCDPGGLWSIRAGAYRTPTLTLTDSDFTDTSAVEVTPRQSRQDTFNGVRGLFISPINQWTPADFVPVKNDTYMGWDGGLRLWKDVIYNFTTSSAMAQRLAKIDLERGRQQIVVVSDFKLKAMQAKPGDVIMLTRARMGWSSKPFEVVEWTLKMVDTNVGPAMVVGLVLRETASGVWDWNDGEETYVDLAPNTDFYNPQTVDQPDAPTLSTSNFQQADGTISPRLKVELPTPDDSHVTAGGKVHIEYKKTADGTWLIWTASLRGDATVDYITDVLAGVSYDVRIRWENSRHVIGPYSTTATYVVLDDQDPPGSPTGLGALATPSSVTLDWDSNAETDLLEYRLYRYTSNTPGSAVEIWRGRTSAYTDFSAGTGVKYYWVTAVDRTNNESAKSTEAHATANPATGNKIANVFLRDAGPSAPSAPSGDYVPSGWYDAPPTSGGDYLWISTAEVSSTGVLVGSWSTPVRLNASDGAPGADGADGDDVEVEYSIDGSTSWHGTFADGDYYMRVRVGGGSWNGPMKIFGELEDGSVTTIKIADAAVSDISVAYTAGTINTNSSGGGTMDLQSISITTTGAPVSIKASITWIPLDNFTFTFAVEEDGVDIWSGAQKSNIGSNIMAFNFGSQPSAGSHTYKLKVTWVSAFYQVTPFSQRFLEATALKK